MKIETFTSIVAATLLTGSAYAQNSTSVSVSATTAVIPSTPAPALAPNTTQALAPNQIVYTPRLPSVAELSNAAAAQGLTVERIEQSATQIVAVYKYANGQTNTVSYQTLPPSTDATATLTSQPPTIVYESAPRVVYYDSYDPFWYPPVSIRLGFGFGYHGGYGYRSGFGYRGGFHHGRW